MTFPWISDVRYVRAPSIDRETGLLGFISLVVSGHLRLDGIALRRSKRGLLYLAFPAKGPGRQHPFIEPTCGRARRELEREVLAALGVEWKEAP